MEKSAWNEKSTGTRWSTVSGESGSVDDEATAYFMESFYTNSRGKAGHEGNQAGNEVLSNGRTRSIGLPLFSPRLEWDKILNNTMRNLV